MRGNISGLRKLRVIEGKLEDWRQILGLKSGFEVWSTDLRPKGQIWRPGGLP